MEQKPIDPAALLLAATAFTNMRNAIKDLLTDNLRVEDGYRIEGHDAAAEAMIFYFADALSPIPTQGADDHG